MAADRIDRDQREHVVESAHVETPWSRSRSVERDFVMALALLETLDDQDARKEELASGYSRRRLAVTATQ